MHTVYAVCAIKLFKHSGSYLQGGESIGRHKLQTGQLTTAVCKQMEQVIACYLRQVGIIGCNMVNMDLDRDTGSKVKYLQFART